MTNRKLSDDDLRDIHAANDADSETDPADIIEMLAAKFPIPTAPKPVRYRLREGAVIHFGHDGGAFIERDGNSWQFLEQDDFEPIPDEPAKQPGVFKRGDWVRDRIEGEIGWVTGPASIVRGLVPVAFEVTGAVDMTPTNIDHTEAPK